MFIYVIISYFTYLKICVHSIHRQKIEIFVKTKKSKKFRMFSLCVYIMVEKFYRNLLIHKNIIYNDQYDRITTSTCIIIFLKKSLKIAIVVVFYKKWWPLQKQWRPLEKNGDSWREYTKKCFLLKYEVDIWWLYEPKMVKFYYS